MMGLHSEVMVSQYNVYRDRLRKKHQLNNFTSRHFMLHMKYQLARENHEPMPF